METFVPFYDRVAMEPITEEKTASGFFVPASVAKDQASKYRVVSMGPGKYDVDTKQHVPMQVKVGDEVYVNRYLGMTVKVKPGNELLVQREDEILGRAPAREASGG